SSLPVDFATIALVGIDSIPINGEISNELGEFIIKNIVSGTYRLIVQHLEYETYYSELFQMTSNNYFVYPDIVLIGSSINLDEVVITGRKAMIEI
ncbi:MAG TPA: hypothetical protein PKD85_11570, partial [Saprospiraceae bacterium]|nr:hypothetical protein [Saprospiraceae bacterium]